MRPSPLTGLLRSTSLASKGGDSVRPLSISAAALNKEGGGSGGGGFFGNFFDRNRVIEVQHSTHQSKLSSAREEIVELQTHSVRPGAASDYAEAHRRLSAHVAANRGAFKAQSLGNFRVVVGGEEDQHVHLWRFDDGYGGADASLQALREDGEYRALRAAVAKCLKARTNQYLMPFGFWPAVEMRDSGTNIYELRSYQLKPGTMIEWGNYWAKGIAMRSHKNKEAFIGLFSQVGDLYNVKHIWCYDSLEERRAARENVWQKEQERWEDIVTGTTPLVRRMSSR